MQFCYEYFDFIERNDLFDSSLSAMLSQELHYNSTHGSLYANEIDRPALMYACRYSQGQAWGSFTSAKFRLVLKMIDFLHFLIDFI